MLLAMRPLRHAWMHAGSLESTLKASVALRLSPLATLRFSRALQTFRVHPQLDRRTLTGQSFNF